MKCLAGWIFVFLLQPVLSSDAAEGVSYTNIVRKGPLSIHVIRFPRNLAAFEIRSLHSAGNAVGLGRLSDQLKLLKDATPVAAINGDFYQRNGPFAGDPRGLQIVDGELISAPARGASFWINANGQPQIAVTDSALRVVWPDGATSPLGLNGRCEPSDLQLYTPTLGSNARANAGREFVMVSADGSTNLSFRAGADFSMSVREIRNAGAGPVEQGTFVLAVGPAAARKIPQLQAGSKLRIISATIPSVRGATQAIGGGPTLVLSGKNQRFNDGDDESYQLSSMRERHPRSAIGWSDSEFIWVSVDGRQRASIGMRMDELAALMMELGCKEAMNLDGGGSSTLWFEGKVRNRPCDGGERPVANSLVLVRKKQ